MKLRRSLLNSLLLEVVEKTVLIQEIFNYGKKEKNTT
nr:MAG TPA: hypothetical protein [Bacteriophage sp.]